jgi:small subunit ribosomal protein S6
LRFYETTIVLSPQADDATIEREIEKVSQTVTGAEGKLVTTQKWGVKRMAYPIMDHAQAYYIHFVYQSPPSVPGSLESMFRINENILRHLTILVDGPLASTRAAEMAAAHAKPAYSANRSATKPPETAATSKDAPVTSEETTAVVQTVVAPAEDEKTVPAGEQAKSSESSE